MPRTQKSGLTGGAFSKLKAMPQYPEVVLRLDRGDSFYSVAKWLKSKKLFPTLKLKSLARQISRFWTEYKGSKKDAPPPAQGSTALVPVSDSEPVDHETEIAEIKALEDLAETQKSRLDMAHENEKTVKFLFPGVRQEVAELRVIYHTLFDKKAALGVYDGGPAADPTNVTHIQVNVENIDQRQAIAVLNNPSSRRKILSAIKNAGALVADEDADDRRVVITDRKRVIDVDQDDATGND